MQKSFTFIVVKQIIVCIFALNINTNTMKVSNNIKIDFNSNSERVYELTAVCKTAAEVEQVFLKLENANNLVVDCFEDLDVTIIAEAWRYDTKQDFIKSVKNLLK